MGAARKLDGNAASGRKPTLSPSRIRTYLECAVKYRYIYHDKIGRYYLRAHSYNSFGSTLHNVLQNFYEQGAAQTPDQMVDELTRQWVTAGYESVEQEQTHLAAGEQIVQAYHTAHQERIAAHAETLCTEKTITCDMGRFKLSGRVDRIDRYPDGRLEIIDYKSGRWDISSDEVAEDLAMSCYQLILKRLYPEVPVVATIYCLRSGNQASAELIGDPLEEFARDLVSLGDQILDRDYADILPVPVPSCPYCDFLPRCTRFWRAQERHAMADGPMSEHGL